jgi:transcriptional regulator with XRE-family HTH domain
MSVVAVSETFGGNLRKIRGERNLTQEALARELGVSWITVSRYERGKSQPTTNRLHLIADVLETTAAELLKDAA